MEGVHARLARHQVLTHGSGCCPTTSPGHCLGDTSTESRSLRAKFGNLVSRDTGEDLRNRNSSSARGRSCGGSGTSKDETVCPWRLRHSPGHVLPVLCPVLPWLHQPADL